MSSHKPTMDYFESPAVGTGRISEWMWWLPRAYILIFLIDFLDMSVGLFIEGKLLNKT